MKILGTLMIFCRFSHIGCSATPKLEIVVSFFLDVLRDLFKNARSLDELLSHFRGIFNSHEISRREVCIHFTLNVVRCVNFGILTFDSQKGVANIVVPDEFNWDKVHPNLHIIDIFNLERHGLSVITMCYYELFVTKERTYFRQTTVSSN